MKQLRMFEEEITASKRLFKKFVSEQKYIVYFIVQSPYLRRLELAVRIEEYYKL